MAATAVDMAATALPAATGADMADPWADMVDMADIKRRRNVNRPAAMDTDLEKRMQTWKNRCRLGNTAADLETWEQTLKQGVQTWNHGCRLGNAEQFGFEKRVLTSSKTDK
jgi:hypothetical protein